ncbi:MAG: hypothetical protein C4B58_08605 [Deltaproteobacteria bacterium]|nr:MAG: hypothetical protein C4B58_08605 [Deltaproteobacteria bacterium]
MEALEFLDRNDVYHFFEKTNDLLMTGPTNTNVMDVRLVLVCYRFPYIQFHCVIGRRSITIRLPPSGLVKLNI